MKKYVTRAFWTSLTAFLIYCVVALGIVCANHVSIFGWSGDAIPLVFFEALLLVPTLASGGVASLAWFFITPDTDGVYRVKRGAFFSRFYANSKSKDFSFCNAFWQNAFYVLYIGMLSTMVVFVTWFLYFTGTLLGTILYFVITLGAFLLVNAFLRLDTSDTVIATMLGLCIFTFSACCAGFGVLPVVKTILHFVVFSAAVAAFLFIVYCLCKVGVQAFRYFSNEDWLHALHGDMCPRVVIVDDPAEQEVSENSPSQKN